MQLARNERKLVAIATKQNEDDMSNTETIESRLQHAVELLDGDRDAFVCRQPLPLTASAEQIAGEYLSAIDAIKLAVACIAEMEGAAKERAAEIAALAAERDDAHGMLLAQAADLGRITAERDALRNAVTKELDSQARQIEALTAELDELRKRLDDATPATGEWIEWRGGECPFYLATSADIRFRDAGEVRVNRADLLDWGWRTALRQCDGDIIAYRIIP